MTDQPDNPSPNASTTSTTTADANNPTTKCDCNKEYNWAMILHISQLCGFIIPFVGIIAPIVIWQVKKTEMPSLNQHGLIVTNWILTGLVLSILFGLMCFILIGIPLLIALGVAGVAFPIIGAIKASKGEVWPYPCTIKFLK
jgi:uncharacterized Tic20 family protein